MYTPAQSAARPRLADALALAAGALLVLAYAPFGLRGAAVAAPAVLFWLWAQDGPRAALRHGYLFGLGMFGGGVSWIYNSLHYFGAAIAPLAALITGLFVVFLALYPALLGWVLARSRDRGALFLLVIAPAGWVLAEWLRGWLLTGFPWLYLGHAQVDTWLGGIAPVLGVLGASWLAALMAGAAAYAARVRGGRRLTALALALGVWAGGGLLSRLDWTRPAGEPFTATLIQGGIAQARKWDPEQFEATLELYRRMTEAHWGDALIIWPESAIPSFVFEVYDDYLKPLGDEARAAGSDLLLGVFSYEPETRRIYNSVVSWGATPGVYHKRHLVPFGEYLPLRGLLGWLDGLIDIPMSDLSPGAGRPLLHAAGQPVGVSICYEDAFGEEVIDALPEATVLVNVSNDAWFGPLQAPQQHLEIARMRALETGRYLLRATNTGISAVIGPRGELLGTLPSSESGPAALSMQVQPRAGMPPYARWGNAAVLALVGALLILAVAAQRLRGEG